MTARQQEQASFLGGDLTQAFLGEAGAESVGGNGSGVAEFPTVTGACCRIVWRSVQVCPSLRNPYCTQRCTVFC